MSSDNSCGGVCACRQACGIGDGEALIIASATGHTVGEVARLARANGRAASVRGGFARITGDDLPGFAALAASTLSATETAEARATLIPADLDVDAAIAAGISAPTLRVLAARHEHADVLELVADELAFWSAYQPIVDLRTGDVVAHEALLRADHDGETVHPGRLFGAAEAAGWTHVLDRIGRETAIRHASSWLGTGSLFINFIPTSIYRPELCLRTTEQASHGAGIALDQLVFEVVEGHRIDDLDHLERIFDHYRDRGCRVALDDVGSGYASLNVLARLRPDVVKLDMELVQGLPEAGHRAIVKAIVDMSHGLGAIVVAEGIETAEQHHEVVELGCDLGQGWLLGRPERKTGTVPDEQRRELTSSAQHA